VKIGTPRLDNPYERPDFIDEGFDYFINAFGYADAELLYPCPCCHFPTLTTRGGFEVCPVCYWEDDGQDSHDADRVRGGPNGSLSLTNAIANFAKIGACAPTALDRVRKPTCDEILHRR
jgi:Cysteine-rich CPCC